MSVPDAPAAETLAVTVVGAGIMGLGAAWALARRGHRVRLFEQYAIPNPLGSSVDSHRLIRHPYGAEAGYAAMVDHAFASWDRLWADLGERHYLETGTLVVSAEAGGWAADSARVLAELGRPVTPLDPATLARRFPQVDPAGIVQAFHLPTGGVLLADRIVAALAHHLTTRGVTLAPATRVAAIDPDRAQVTLENGQAVGADMLVVACGPWVRRLAPELAGRVTPSRQMVAYVEPPDGVDWRNGPMLINLESEAGFYLVPPVAGTGLKIGDHRFTLTGSPDDDRTPGAEEAEAVLALARRRLAGGARYRVASGRVCFYTCTADERFIVEPLGRRTWVMTGFSGHGFKFGAAMGEAMAAAVEHPTTAISRWAAGAAVPPPVA